MVLDAQSLAVKDAEYMALHAEYVPTRDRFGALCNSLTLEQQQIIDDYITAAVKLHHRLMALACSQTPTDT